jgi:uncharacterized protein YndB with AHSA1/START domain
MTGETRERSRILGTLRSADGVGVVRMEDRFDVVVDEVWMALTAPPRLVDWLGEFEGDLRRGGKFRAHFTASGWEGTGRIDVCEPPRRLQVTMRDADPQPGQPDEGVTEVALAPDGDGTIVVWEERGMPVDLLAAYGRECRFRSRTWAPTLRGVSVSTGTPASRNSTALIETWQ